MIAGRFRKERLWVAGDFSTVGAGIRYMIGISAFLKEIEHYNGVELPQAH
jgi:hypothetical protein